MPTTISAPFLVPTTNAGTPAGRSKILVLDYMTRYGSTVVVNGTISVLAIPDEDHNKVNQWMMAMNLDKEPEGRKVLFHFSPTAPDSSVEIRSIYWDGQYFSVMPSRAVGATETRVLRTVMGSAGGVVF